jgi:hypothetical protein
LRVEDAEVSSGGEWDEVLRNPRINRESSLLYLGKPQMMITMERKGGEEGTGAGCRRGAKRTKHHHLVPLFLFFFQISLQGD